MSAVAAIPGAAPLAPAAATVIRVAPAVRRIIRTLRHIDIPAARRRLNWKGDRGEGSCVHAALVHLLHWQGRHALADAWAARNGNGETADGLSAKLDQAGLRFAETRVGDEAFLEWALRTRRGAAVVVQNGAHMVNLVGLDRQHAHLLDSNAPDRIQHVPRDAFLRDWKQSGGWAVTPVGSPSPPDPWVVREQAVGSQLKNRDRHLAATSYFEVSGRSSEPVPVFQLAAGPPTLPASATVYSHFTDTARSTSNVQPTSTISDSSISRSPQ